MCHNCVCVCVCVWCRIRDHVAGGAWCPSQPIGKDNIEYLEVDVGRLMVITLVETQGRFDNGQVTDIFYIP